MNRIFVYLLTISLFNLFFLTPLLWIQELTLLFLSVFFLVSFFLNSKAYRDLFFLIYPFTLFSTIAIIISFLNYKDSFVSTIIANKEILYAYSSFLIYKIFVKIGLDNCLKWMFHVALIYSLIVAIFSIIGIEYTFISFLSGQETLIEPTKLQIFPVYYSCFYLYNLYRNRGKSTILLVLAILILFVPHLYDIQRKEIIVLITIVTVFTINFRNFLLRPLTIIFTMILGFFVYSLSRVGILQLKFQDFFKVFSLSYEDLQYSSFFLEDASIWVRISEIFYAIEKGNQSPIFGNGAFRTSNKEILFGDEYFFPADIGLFGIYFLYGFLGLFLYIYFFKVAISKKIAMLNSNISFVYLSLIFLIIQSSFNAKLFLTPTIFIFLLIFKFKLIFNSRPKN